MKPDTLDRYVPLFEPPEQPLEGFYRLRDRKRRNRRIGALVLVAVIALAAVAALRAITRESTMRVPANEAISLADVAALHEVAYDITMPRQQGYRLASGDGVLVMGTSRYRGSGGALIAYPFPCGDVGAPCAPVWRAHLNAPALPTIDDGMVYVTGQGSDTLTAIPTDCTPRSGSCTPSWTADIGAPSTSQPPLVVGDRVYVGTESGVRSYSTSTTCDTPCAPVWQVATGVPVRALAADGGVLYAGTGRAGGPDAQNRGAVSAYQLGCNQGTCLLGMHDVGQVWDLAVDNATLYVGTNGHRDGVQAYPTACIEGAGPCSPEWIAATHCCTVLATADGTVYADDQTNNIYALPEGCGADGSACTPTWSSTGTVIGEPFVDFERPLIADGVVFVGGDPGFIYAFAQNCDGPCGPVWKTLVHDTNGIPGNWDAATLGDQLYVAASDGLHVFSASSQSAAQTASHGSRDALLFYGVLALAAGAWLILRIRRRRLG